MKSVFDRIMIAMVYAAMVVGGIACIIGGIEADNHGAPIAGAILIIGSIYLANQSDPNNSRRVN